MHGVIAGFDTALDTMSETRLRVQSRASGIESMPLAHASRIAQVQGVGRVASFSAVGAYYQEPKNAFPSAGLDIEAFLEVLPEIKVPPEQVDLMMRTRTGAIIGATLAEKYGWSIGDRVPIKSFLWTNEDGTADWIVEITAIANAGPNDDQLFAGEMYLHWDYLDESRATGKGTVHQFIVAIDDPTKAGPIAEEIDALFANSSDETSTVNEREYITSFVRQAGDVRSFVAYVLGAVLFTLLFLTGTTMMQSIRDRTAEFGVLKSIGFTDTTVFVMVLIESLVLCILAALLGLGIAATVFPNIFASIGFDGMSLAPSVVATGVGIAAAMAIGVAFWPAWRARRLSVAAATSGR
jgi:putative ABC transport system permease protein